MSVVARFDGIKIQFYWDEHPPPHFHAETAEYRAQVHIDRLVIIKGYLPPNKLRKVVEWARPRRKELHMAWFECRSDLVPGKIG